MLQEVNLEKALKKAATGKEVLILTTMDDGSMAIESLSDILQGARFLVEVPAVINEEFEVALPKAAPPPNAKTGEEEKCRCRKNPCTAQCGLVTGKDRRRDEVEHRHSQPISEHGQAGEER